MRAEELTEQKYRTRYITPLYKILKNPSFLLLSAITLLGAGLRLYRLSYQSFWEDELYSWWASSFASPAMVIRVGVLPDIHPPGYQLLMYLVQRLGADGEFGLRLPSAVAGILAIPLLYWLGYKLYGPMEGLIAAAFLAVLHFPIYYSQEARSYALVLLFVLLTAVLSLDLFSAKPQLLTPYLLLPAAIALAYLHYFGLLFVILLGGTAVFLATHYRRNKMRLVLSLFGLVGAAYLLWLPGIVTQLQISNRGLWITPPENIVETFLALFYQFFNQRWQPAYLMLGLILVAVISWLKKRKTYKNLPNATLFLLLWLVIPFGMTYLFSVLVTPIFTYRNLIIILPAALLLAARGLTQIPQKWGQIGAASLLTGVLLWQVAGGDYYTAPHKTQFREAAAIIVNQEAEDALIIGQMAYPFLLDYYFSRHNLPQRVALIVEENRICRGTKYTFSTTPDIPLCPTTAYNFAPQNDPDYREKLFQYIDAEQPEHIWYVYGRFDLLINPHQFIHPAYQFQQRFELAGIHLYLFKRR